MTRNLRVGILAFVLSMAGTCWAQDAVGPPIIAIAPPGILSEGTNQPETVLEGAPLHTTCGIADAAGNLWIGTEDGGLWRYEPATKAWKQFTTKDGLGDDTVYALATDHAGRLWAGHLNHGVSVFNGQAWHNYSNWGGPAGPLGARVFAIAVSPTDGDVWIATELGISRYSDKLHQWSFITQVDGLPENNIRGIAFDSLGNVYLAMATTGLAIGHAADGFAKWEHVTGPDQMPAAPTGDGLPGNLANCVAVDPHDAIYLGTTRGLAVSTDRGTSWKFFRGKDWVDLINGQHPDASEKISSDEPALLNEDWINQIAIDDGGTVWIGFRKQGYERLDMAAKSAILTETDAPPAPPVPEGTKPRRPMNNVVGLVIHGVGEQPLILRYEPPAAWCTAADAKLLTADLHPPAGAADFPAPALPPTFAELTAAMDRIAQLKPVDTHAAYLGEDWMTQGDWVGRYGRDRAALLGLYDKPGGEFGKKDVYPEEISVGLHREAGPHYWYAEGDEAQQRRVLWNPSLGQRIQGELNDGSYDDDAYPAAVEGPGMWLRVTIPPGAHRLALYFGNYDGQSGKNMYRDFVLELRRQPDTLDADTLADPAKLTDAVLTQPILATARVSNYRGGVYERFLLTGKADQTTYWIHIRRNHSFVTKIQATFIDRLGPATPETETHTDFDPPADPQPVDPSSLPAPAQAALQLDEAISASLDRDGIDRAFPAQLRAYQALQAANVSDALLARYRWKFGLWTAADRDKFEPQMKEAFAQTQAKP